MTFKMSSKELKAALGMSQAEYDAIVKEVARLRERHPNAPDQVAAALVKRFPNLANRAWPFPVNWAPMTRVPRIEAQARTRTAARRRKR
jgi:hypothetical protein